MIYLGWLVEEHPNICDRLVYLSQPLPDKPDFLFIPFVRRPDRSNKYLFLASQGFAAEKLMVKPRSLRKKFLGRSR